MTWKWVIGPASGGHELELTAATNRAASWSLVGSDEAKCTIDGRHPQAATVKDLATDLHVLRNGELLYRGRVGATSDVLTQLAHQVTVESTDYRELLRRRLLYADSTLTYAAADQAAIAWGLVQDTQNRVGGALGITRGAGQSTGRLRDRTYLAGAKVGALIDDLGGVIDGFDWHVRPVSASALALDVFYPQRGTDRGVILDHGGAFAAGGRNVLAKDYANAVRVSGAEGTVAQVRTATDLATRPEGRWDAQFGFTDITVQSTLDERATAELVGAQTIIPSWTVRLKSGWWQGPGHVWIGDPVRLVVMSGRLKVDTSLRVFELEADVGPSGEETITVTLGAPRPDFARRQRADLLRLDKLERR